jgi:hypothetical protein
MALCCYPYERKRLRSSFAPFRSSLRLAISNLFTPSQVIA